jgi:polyferredoxin
MGIDIRQGAQIECINCGLCIDACDEIMARVERPKGLIAYDTDEAVAARKAHQTPTYPLIRSRTLYYGVALAAVSSLMLWGFLNRSPVGLEALHDRNPTFVRLHDGSVRDGYTLKIDNRSWQSRAFRVSLAGVAGATLQTPGAAPTAAPLSITVAPNQVLALRVLATAPSSALTAQSLPVTFSLAGDGHTWSVASTFLSSDVAAQ